MNDELKTEIVTPAKAITRITTLSKTRKVYLSVHQYSPIAGEEGKVFPIYGNVMVGKKAAQQYIKNAYEGFADRGAMVTLKYYDNCLFVG